MAAVRGTDRVPPAGQPALVRGHVPALDGVRGVAILLVLMSHAIGLPLEHAHTALDASVRVVARVGWTGVDLFFVLSGFLITGILLDTRNEERRWRFFARRGLRIFPLYYGVLCFLFIVFPMLVSWSEPAYATLRNSQAWYWAYLVNFLDVFSQGTRNTLNTSHFWSLSIEEQFYIFWPFVVWSCRAKTLLRVIAVTLILGFLGRLWLVTADPFHYGASSYLLTPVRLDGLMTGAVLAVLARSRGGMERFRALGVQVAAAGAVVLGAVAIVRGGLFYYDPVVAVIGLPLVALTFGGLLASVVAAPTESFRNRLFSSRFLQSWGKYSYGIYVFHYLIIGAFGWFFPLYQRESPWLGGSRLPAVLAFAMLIGAISWAVAWISYHVYEKRFLALKRYFEKVPVRNTGAPFVRSPSPGFVKPSPEP